MSNRSPYDIPAANECNECEGRGYPYSTAQHGRLADGQYVTTEIGYGCLECLGVGRLVDEQNEK